MPSPPLLEIVKPDSFDPVEPPSKTTPLPENFEIVLPAVVIVTALTLVPMTRPSLMPARFAVPSRRIVEDAVTEAADFSSRPARGVAAPTAERKKMPPAPAAIVSTLAPSIDCLKSMSSFAVSTPLMPSLTGSP